LNDLKGSYEANEERNGIEVGSWRGLYRFLEAQRHKTELITPLNEE
jgi:hypothetical protein